MPATHSFLAPSPIISMCLRDPLPWFPATASGTASEGYAPYAVGRGKLVGNYNCVIIDRWDTSSYVLSFLSQNRTEQQRCYNSH